MNRLVLTAGVAVLLTVACARPSPRSTHAGAACKEQLDTTALERLARDTISELRHATQRVERVLQSPQRFVVWTEDTNRLANHDGGRVGFGCDGRVRLIWLDGG